MGNPTFLVLGVLLIVVFIVMLLGIIWAGDKAADIMVGQKHRVLDEVLRTRDVPANWRQPYIKRVSHAHDARRLREVRNRAKADYLRRLNGLTSYVQSTKLVEDEETRVTVLQQLASIQDSWEVKDADGF